MTRGSTVRVLPRWRRRLRTTRTVLGIILLVALVGGILVQLAQSAAEGDRLRCAAVFLALLALVPLALLTHELGHLFGGRLVGLRVALLVVGPLKLQRVGDRLKAKVRVCSRSARRVYPRPRQGPAAGRYLHRRRYLLAPRSTNRGHYRRAGRSGGPTRCMRLRGCRVTPRPTWLRAGASRRALGGPFIDCTLRQQ